MFLVQKIQMWKSVPMAYITLSIVYIEDVMCEMFSFIFWTFGWNQIGDSLFYFILIPFIERFRKCPDRFENGVGFVRAFVFIWLKCAYIYLFGWNKSRGPYIFIVIRSIYFESEALSSFVNIHPKRTKHTHRIHRNYLFFLVTDLYYYLLRNEWCSNVCLFVLCTYYTDENWTTWMTEKASSCITTPSHYIDNMCYICLMYDANS